MVLAKLRVEFEWWTMVEYDGSVIRGSGGTIRSDRTNGDAVDGAGVTRDLSYGISSIKCNTMSVSTLLSTGHRDDYMAI